MIPELCGSGGRLSEHPRLSPNKPTGPGARPNSGITVGLEKGLFKPHGPEAHGGGNGGGVILGRVRVQTPWTVRAGVGREGG